MAKPIDTALTTGFPVVQEFPIEEFLETIEKRIADLKKFEEDTSQTLLWSKKVVINIGGKIGGEKTCGEKISE